jgi:hypothetical protein
MSKEAVKILKGLLQKDPTKRLGYKSGFEEVKRSEFCQGINWEALMKQQVTGIPPAKFIPSSTSQNLLVNFFDAEYTKMSPRLSLVVDLSGLESQALKVIKMKRSKSLQTLSIGLPTSSFNAAPEILIV